MTLPSWAAPFGYVLFCLATVVQLFCIFGSYGVIGDSLWHWSFERGDLVAPLVTALVTGIAWIGWILHRPPTARNRGLYIIFQICLFGVPFFCGTIFAVATIFAGGNVGVICAGVIFISLVLLAGTSRYRRGKNTQPNPRFKRPPIAPGDSSLDERR
jgi:hypothetical protein